ncbi:MAG: asparagine synthetase B, partial [Alphaproteobacteria bacterium]
MSHAGSYDPASEEVRMRRALARLRHRGPDDKGLVRFDDIRLLLGHRRLAVIDPSPAGHQPMRSHGGGQVLVYNGEIYNSDEIRQRLEEECGAIAWRGHSDSEVLLEALSRWGVEKTLTRIDGMFAFALHDRRLRRLVLARDRMGEKPLYYGLIDGRFAFASELAPLVLLLGRRPAINRRALASLLAEMVVPAPW